METLVVLTKITTCMAFCYLLYYVVLRHFTFFALNRWYLLASLVLSMVVPFVHIPIERPVQAAYTGVINNLLLARHQVNVVMVKSAIQAAPAFNWLSIAVQVYWVVVILLGARLLFVIARIVFTAVKHGQRVNGYIIVHNSSGQNSSFFKLIFLDVTRLNLQEQEQVLAHEQAHARLWHSADNVLMAVAKVFLWFNPFVYLFAASVRQNHEFEADRLVAGGADLKSYAQLLYKLSARQMPLVMQFSAGGLKKRIAVLLGKPSAGNRKWVYVVVTGVVVLFFAVLSTDVSFAKAIPLENIFNPSVETEVQEMVPASTQEYNKPGKKRSSFKVQKLSITRVSTDTPKRKMPVLKFEASDSAISSGDSTVSFTGNVVVTMDNIKLKADFVRMDRKGHTIFARNVIIEEMNLLEDKLSLNKPFKVDSLVFNYETGRAKTYTAGAKQ